MTNQVLPSAGAESGSIPVNEGAEKRDPRIWRIVTAALIVLGLAVTAASIILAFTVHPLFACGLVPALLMLGVGGRLFFTARGKGKEAEIKQEEPELPQVVPPRPKQPPVVSQERIIFEKRVTSSSGNVCTFFAKKGQICQQHVDVIVNAANTSLVAGGGVCGAIFSNAGPNLQAECDTKKPCAEGQAKLTSTGGRRKPEEENSLEKNGIKGVIHAVGPVWTGGMTAEKRALLKSAYKESLRLAEQAGHKSIAFSFLSAAIFASSAPGSRELAVGIGLETIREYLQDEATSIREVYMMAYSADDLKALENCLQQETLAEGDD
ncbi:MAG: O-acetyl-ADP-ribose deacetylase [Chlamydiae bacterium]|nr:O-acetyl-ADP-ribose deacetylase [Chlamydiota bacterium]